MRKPKTTGKTGKPSGTDVRSASKRATARGANDKLAIDTIEAAFDSAEELFGPPLAGSLEPDVITAFEWDEENVLGVQRKQLLPEEVETVFAGCYAARRADACYFVAIGNTLDEQTLLIVLRRSKGVTRVVSARKADARERRLLRSRAKPMISSEPRVELRFARDSDAVRYFEKHSAAEVWPRLRRAYIQKLTADLQATAMDRRRASVSLQVALQHVATAKKLVAPLEGGVESKLRLWITAERGGKTMIVKPQSKNRDELLYWLLELVSACLWTSFDASFTVKRSASA